MLRFIGFCVVAVLTVRGFIGFREDRERELEEAKTSAKVEE